MPAAYRGRRARERVSSDTKRRMKRKRRGRRRGRKRRKSGGEKNIIFTKWHKYTTYSKQVDALVERDA